LSQDTTDEVKIRSLMHVLGDNVERRLKRKKAAGRSVQLMIRYHDRKTITRSKKLQVFIDTKEEIIDVANELWQEHWNMQPIRLLDIMLQDIEEKKRIVKQLDLLTYEKEAEKEKIHHTIDTLSEKYR